MTDNGKSLQRYYIKYRNVILFNKDIFIAAIITGVTDILIVGYSSLLYQDNHFLISAISLIFDFTVYNSVFITLFFLDNRRRYINADGRRNRKRLKEDGKKLITSLGISEIAYLTTKFLATYIVLASLKMEPLEVSLTSTILAWIFYIVSANIMIRRQRLFQE